MYEKVGNYRGIPYAVGININRGYRSGYVGIPENHKLYQVPHNKNNINLGIDMDFSGYLKQLDGYFYGWDHNHIWDGVDEGIIRQYCEDEEILPQLIREAWEYRENKNTRAASLEDVEDEIRSVIDKLLLA